MQQTDRKLRVIFINFLAAAAIALVVNFFFFVNLITNHYSGSGGGNQPPMWYQQQMQGWYVTLQILYFMLFAFVLLSVCTANIRSRRNSSGFTMRLIICILIALAFYFLTPRLGRGGDIMFLFQRPPRRMLDATLILQCSLTLTVAMLYGKIFELIFQKQNIQLENEVLKNENLQATYNSLVNQTNPHFFFNSLNSLAMLVRERHNDKALEYIDRLSESFRYILQKGQTETTTLDEELKFLAAYTYMLDIRYDGKIFFDIEVDPKYRSWTLPTLSLQPLIENAVKHNTITKSKPLRISIRTDGENVVVSNPIIPRLDKENGTGIGLSNLAARYSLLTGREIAVGNKDGVFEVVLPLKQA